MEYNYSNFIRIKYARLRTEQTFENLPGFDEINANSKRLLLMYFTYNEKFSADDLHCKLILLEGRPRINNSQIFLTIC